MRYRILAASVAIQICLGGVYAWSVFAVALDRELVIHAERSGFIFGLTIAVFTLTMIPAGRLLSRSGPRVMMALSGGLFAAGYLWAGYRGDFPGLVLGIGVLAGMGIGCGYVVPLATCTRWFPDKLGMVIGLAVAGFGAGGIVLSGAVEHALEAGVAVTRIFQWIGIGYGALIALAGSLLCFPPRAGSASHAPVALGWTRMTPLMLGIFAGSFGGLLIIGHLDSIALDAGLPQAGSARAVMWFAAGNAAGRILWGIFYDRAGRAMLPVSLGALAVCIASLALVRHAPGLMSLSAAAVGFGFGGCFVLYATDLSRRHGAAVMTRMYPWVFLFYGLAALIAPGLGGYLRLAHGRYLEAILLAAAVPAGAALLFPPILRRADPSPPPAARD
ncbi:MAG: MFS transporter [Kiritimatiellae bacterium]|nr:MFS transporter [Kiritimatiellia bacterium]